MIFLSTPSGWRATYGLFQQERRNADISIHALRVEGDNSHKVFPAVVRISIHALRVEGDAGPLYHAARRMDFYPRPPGGGRLQHLSAIF